MGPLSSRETGSYCQLSLVSCVSTLEQRSWRRCLDALNRTSKKVPDSIYWESSFGPPCKGNIIKKLSRKWTLLKSKVVPPGGSSFWPLHCGKYFWSVYFKLKLIWLATAASGNLNRGGPFLRACFFLRFEDHKRVPSLFCFNFPSKLALRGFVLISMVSRHWSLRLALRSAFNKSTVANYFKFNLAGTSTIVLNSFEFP